MPAIPHYVLQSAIGNDSKLLFAILDSYTGRDNAVCWPGQARLGVDLGSKDRHVRDCLMELRAIGAVSWRTIPGPLGRRSIYTLHYGQASFTFDDSGGSGTTVPHPKRGGSGTTVPDGSGTTVPEIQHSIDPAIRAPKAPAQNPAPAARGSGPLAPAESSGGTGQGRAGQGRAEPRPVLARTRAERDELERAVRWRAAPCAKCGADLPDAEIWQLHNGRRVPSVVVVGYSEPYFDSKGARKLSFRSTAAYHRDCAIAEKLTK